MDYFEKIQSNLKNIEPEICLLMMTQTRIWWEEHGFPTETQIQNCKKFDYLFDNINNAISIRNKLKHVVEFFEKRNVTHNLQLDTMQFLSVIQQEEDFARKAYPILTQMKEEIDQDQSLSEYDIPEYPILSENISEILRI
jgi:hypothetical protein